MDIGNMSDEEFENYMRKIIEKERDRQIYNLERTVIEAKKSMSAEGFSIISKIFRSVIENLKNEESHIT